MQFIHNGSDNPPSYDATVFTDMWANTGSQAATVNFGIPVLVNNMLSINQGKTRTLTTWNLSATDLDGPDNALLFTVSNLEHGQFEELGVPGVAITAFIQQKIINQEVQFVHDGTPNPPSYDIILSDDTYVLSPASASITFNYSPVLEANNLSIERGKTVFVTSKNLKASDRETPAKNLIFSIYAIRNGHFELTSMSGIPITQFTQGQIDLVDVEFIHDGSPNVPSYNVTVSDSQMTTHSSAALINWDPRLLQQQADLGSDYTVRNTLLATFLSVGVVGSLLLCYISMGFLKNRRLKNVGQRGNQAHFYKTVIIPIAKTVFKQIKVTGFMNYISTNQMEAYVAEIVTVINEINQLGINIELQEIDSIQQTQLLNQIVKQMKRHLGIQTGVCNRAWFASFFKAQVRPEVIGAKAKLIANSVHAALMGNPDEDLDEHFDEDCDGIELSTVRLLAGDERRDSMNSQDILYNRDIEIDPLQNLLEEGGSQGPPFTA